MNTKSKGDSYEERAAEYLHREGYRIIERNFRCKMGEIDIIAQKKNVIHFVEVKYRSSLEYGSPMSAVDYRRRKRQSNAAMYYMYSHGRSDTEPVSFDVIAVSKLSLMFFENAFDYCGKY